MADDHDIALEISVQNIDDTNESDEELERMSVMSGFSERIDEEGRNGGNTYRSLAPHRQPLVPAISLRRILEDERSFTLFRRFLKDGCITRNLQFWLACEHYRTQPYDKNKLMELAKAIYSKFLGSSAPLHVSVMDGTKRSIQMSVQLKAEPDINLFRQAQLEVYQQMEGNELRQFLLSDSFSDCSQFNQEEGLAYFQPETFQPARYRGGSLHSGSDDSTSITSFNSEDMGGTVLCAPRMTRLSIIRSPRNAHSDTEHCSSRSRHTTGKTTFFSRGKSLTSTEFYEILYERLVAVEKDRANLQRRARNIAREEGKSYEDIMSFDWYDAPEAVKYVKFDEEGNSTGVNPGTLKPLSEVDQQGGSPQPEMSNGGGGGGGGGTSHIASMAAKEIQEALKDLEITRQVRQKRATSVMSTSSASSYISDSGVGESLLPSSGGGSGLLHRAPHRVQAYIQSQNQLSSQLSDREQNARLAATMLINNSTHHEDLNPNGRRIQYHNYQGAYSSDDSSSCFTTTTHSSNSEFFVPRRSNGNFYTDSDDTRHHPRYPQGMRRVRRSTHTSTQQTPLSGTTHSRYFQHQPSPHHPPPSNALSSAPPQQQPSSRDVPPAVHNPPSGDLLLVAYTIDGYPNTMAKRIPISTLTTLGDFKEKVFKRKGCFRFFFKTYCEDLDQEIMEEMSDDTQLLPHFQGKIIGHVEKAESDS